MTNCRYCNEPIAGVMHTDAYKPNIHNECFWKEVREAQKVALDLVKEKEARAAVATRQE